MVNLALVFVLDVVCNIYLQVLLSWLDRSPLLYARWFSMSHDAIFVPRPIFGFAAIFATHLYAPNPPPIWPLINIKHHWISCKNSGWGVKKGQRGVYLPAWLGVGWTYLVLYSAL